MDSHTVEGGGSREGESANGLERDQRRLRIPRTGPVLDWEERMREGVVSENVVFVM